MRSPASPGKQSSNPLVEEGLPRQAAMVQAPPEAGSADSLVNPTLRMDIAAERLSAQPQDQVAAADREPQPPPVVGIDEPIQPPRAHCGCVDKRRPVAVAAHHSMQGHDVSRLDL